MYMSNLRGFKSFTPQGVYSNDNITLSNIKIIKAIKLF
jgi:hypothetical protein